MPELATYVSNSQLSGWNVDMKNRTYIDPWDLENYVYMKRRLSVSVVPYPSDVTSYVTQPDEPITSMSAKSDFYYIRPEAELSKAQQSKQRKPSLVQEVSAGIDEQHFSNDMYQIYGSNAIRKNAAVAGNCDHKEYQLKKNNRRHSSTIFPKNCQHLRDQESTYGYEGRYQQYPVEDDPYFIESIYDGSTSSRNVWKNYETISRNFRQPAENYRKDASLTPSVTPASTMEKSSQLSYLYQRRRFSQQHEPQSQSYSRQRIHTPIITELQDHDDYVTRKNTILNSTTSAPRRRRKKGKPEDPIDYYRSYETNDEARTIYHDDYDIEVLNDIINSERYHMIGRQPKKHFGLSNFGHLKIDYSNNWSNLDRLIGHS